MKVNFPKVLVNKLINKITLNSSNFNGEVLYTSSDIVYDIHSDSLSLIYLDEDKVK